MLNFCKKHLAASCAVVLFSAALAPVDCIADEAAAKARIERAKIELAKIKQGKNFRSWMRPSRKSFCRLF